MPRVPQLESLNPTVAPLPCGGPAKKTMLAPLLLQPCCTRPSAQLSSSVAPLASAGMAAPASSSACTCAKRQAHRLDSAVAELGQEDQSVARLHAAWAPADRLAAAATAAGTHRLEHLLCSGSLLWFVAQAGAQQVLLEARVPEAAGQVALSGSHICGIACTANMQGEAHVKSMLIASWEQITHPP